MSLQVTIKNDYLHAEKISETAATTINVQARLTVPSASPKWGETTTEIPFALTIVTNPPIYTITVKGRAVVVGKENEMKRLKALLDQRKQVPEILKIISSYTIFEASLLIRELGFPPIIPLPGAPPPPPPEMRPV